MHPSMCVRVSCSVHVCMYNLAYVVNKIGLPVGMCDTICFGEIVCLSTLSVCVCACVYLCDSIHVYLSVCN